MDSETPAPSRKRRVPRWLLEGLFIVVSVALGFAVTQYGESRANAELGARVMRGLQTEVEQNLATLERQVAMHHRWMQALAKVEGGKEGETAREVFLATWPDFNPNHIVNPFPRLNRGAWDAALSTGALRLIDYEVASHLSEIYQLQESIAASVDQLPHTSTAFYEPASRSAAVQQLAFQLNAIELTEGYLLDAYRKHLPAIRAAAGAR